MAFVNGRNDWIFRGTNHISYIDTLCSTANKVESFYSPYIIKNSIS